MRLLIPFSLLLLVGLSLSWGTRSTGPTLGDEVKKMRRNFIRIPGGWGHQPKIDPIPGRSTFDKSKLNLKANSIPKRSNQAIFDSPKIGDRKLSISRKLSTKNAMFDQPKLRSIKNQKFSRRTKFYDRWKQFEAKVWRIPRYYQDRQ